MKIINLFQDIMSNFSPKNVGLEVSRRATFLINRTQLYPKNQVLHVRENSVNLSISAGELHLLPNFQKKKKMWEERLDLNTIYR